MIDLIKFEVKRSKIVIIILVACMMLFGILLQLIDIDHEEIIITLSMLKLFIPFLLIVTMDMVHMNQDFRQETRNLYLAIPKTNTEIIGSKLSFASMNYILYFMMICMFKGVNSLDSYVPFYAIGLILLGLFLQLFVMLTAFQNSK